MTAKWTTNAFAGNTGGGPTSDDTLGGKFVVLLLFGKNSFGDKVYSYLKITLDDLQNLKAAVQAGKGFTPSDFGTVIAAGKGEPTPEVRAEVASLYPLLETQHPHPAASDAPEEKKAWDEY